MTFHRGDAGWNAIAVALDGARILPGTRQDIDNFDLRLGIVISTDDRELSSIYFQDDLIGRASPLLGVMNGRSVVVPITPLATAIHQVMGSVGYLCRAR
jgi:hypothetical protein